MIDLTGKVAIVTGAGRGIGAGIAADLARRGAAVIVNDAGFSVEGQADDTAVAEQVAEQITAAGGRATAHVGDMSSGAYARGAIALALETYGSLDIVVNNAGTLRVKPIWSLDEDDWDSVIGSHLRHTYLLTQGACRWWRDEVQRGRRRPRRIINLVAATGLVGRHDMGANHAAAKGAIAAFTLVTAHEMFPYDVTVNAVSPAAMRTRMADHVGASFPTPTDGAFDPVDPANVAPLVAYVASDEASWVTGQVLRMVGGTVGRYQPWSVVATMGSEARWTAEQLDVDLRKLYGVYPGTIARP